MIKTVGDLITDCKADNYKKYEFQAKEIKDFMKQWNEKMAVLQEQGYSKKKLINAKKKSNKLKDLTYLKSQVPPEPFSTADEACSNALVCIRLPLEENEKNKRLYVEVRYARVLCSTLKETASIFCLKQNERNLMTQEYADNLINCMDDTEQGFPQVLRTWGAVPLEGGRGGGSSKFDGVGDLSHYMRGAWGA